VIDAATTGLVLNTPGVVGSLNVIVVPTHSVVGPVIGSGSGYTLITANWRHPHGDVSTMVSIPVATPNTRPDEEPTVAIEVLVELQVPGSTSDNNVVAPTHSDIVPVIGAGVACTVIVYIAEHPVVVFV